MKTLIASILALGLFAGAASASVSAQTNDNTVVEYSCGYGH